MTRIDRRKLIAGGLAVGAAAAMPAKVFAQGYSITEQHRQLLSVARDQMDRVGSQLWRRDSMAIADYGLPSALPRFHFVNLEAGTVRSFLVAHGRGSDPEHDGFLKSFSNEVGSNATSRGAYISYEWYKGRYGTSIRLGGIDSDNSNALERAIVVHPAWYANPEMLEKYGKLGRSEGCFAMAEADFYEALWNLSGGRMIYADKLGIA